MCYHNMSCAQGEQSLHNNFITTELHVHDDERWPMEVTSSTYFSGVLLCQSKLKGSLQAGHKCRFCSDFSSCSESVDICNADFFVCEKMPHSNILAEFKSIYQILDNNPRKL